MAVKQGSRRGGAPQSVEAILQQALARHGLEHELARHKFVLNWAEIVGSDIAKRSRPEALRRKILFVRVADSIWAQELSFQRQVILARLKKHLSEEVEDIHFFVAGEQGMR